MMTADATRIHGSKRAACLRTSGLGGSSILAILAFCLLAPLQLLGQAWSPFLDSSRAIDWSGAGFTIPSYTVNCATQPTLTSGSGAAGSNATAIQNALASCDATHNVVKIPAGTFYVAGITFPSHGKQVLRGAGPTQTKLISTGQAGCEGYQGGICMIDGSPNYSGDAAVQYNTGSQTCRLATLTKGATTLSLTNCNSAPPLNRLMILDQIVDQADTGGVYACNETTPASCNYDGTGGSYGRPTRNQTQTVYTTGVTSLGGGNYTVTIAAPGIVFTNLQSGRNPGVWWAGGTATLDGLENLTIDGTSDSQYTVNMFDCYQCWVKNVTFLNGGRGSIAALQSGYVVIRDSYFYQAQSSGTSVSYNIETQLSSSGLVENNLIQQTVLPYVINNGTGWVFDYNFAVNEKSFASGFLGAAFASHGAGNQFNLHEGNAVKGYQADDAWGSTTQQTFFRNFLTGWDVGRNQATTPFINRSYVRAMNVVGNVLGQPSYSTQYQAVGTSATASSGLAAQDTSIYLLGIAGNPNPPKFNAAGCGTGTAQSSPSCDALANSTLMRWANWDAVGGVTKFDSTEASPGAVTYVNANFSSSYFTSLAHTLPASLYYSSTPSWWPAGKPFPPIGFDVNSSNLKLCSNGSMNETTVTTITKYPEGSLVTAWGGHANSLPMQDCASALGMPADGTGPALAYDYNAGGCPGSSTPTVPAPSFAPGTGTYSTPQSVTISDSLAVADVQITTQEGSNANASNGDTPSRNLYTNCATTCSSGTPSPSPAGQRWCNSSQVVSCGSFGSSVVASTITGTGTHSLDNGRGAGGDDSATQLTSTYGGSTTNPCASQWGQPTGFPGLTLPAAQANSAAFYSITTQSSNVNTSLLSPTKNTMNTALSDAIDHYLTVSCMDINNTTASGVHAEFDTNHTIATDDYFGFGKHFNFATSKFYFCPQGCSGWKEMDLKEANGTMHTTFSWPANHKIFMYTIDHRDPGCTSSSGSNCMWYDGACFQDVTAGSAQICGNWIDPVTGIAPGGIPVHKSGFTINEINTQTQIDINAASVTIAQNVWRSFVGYNLNGVSIFYTNNGSVPTTSSTPYVAPISVATSQTLKALATAPGYANSPVNTANYTITAGTNYTLTITAPNATVSGTNNTSGTYTSGTTLGAYTITPAAGYTITSITGTGSTAGCTSSPCGSYTIGANSSITVTTVQQTVATPTFSPGAGTYVGTQTVTISDGTSGSTICYTTDGSTPTANGAGACTHGTTYSTPVSVATSETLKAIGSKAAFLDSAVGSAAYVINSSTVHVTLSGTQSFSGSVKVQ